MGRLITTIKRLAITLLHFKKHSIKDESILREIVKNELTLAEFRALSRESQTIGITDKKYCEHNIIVSLTTYGKRIHEVYLALESIMQQTYKPNKIILWISDKEFSNETIPYSLQRLVNRGLTIEFCKDIRSYTKLVPALRKYPNDAIITIDDDLIYSHDILERLIRAHVTKPETIFYCRGHKIVLDSKNNPIPYNKWIFDCKEKGNSPLNFPTGVGGVIYPPHSLHEQVTNEKVFLSLAPMADDVWFKAMALMKDTPSEFVSFGKPIHESCHYIEDVQDMGLFHMNSEQSANDLQIKAVFEKFNLYEKLK